MACFPFGTYCTVNGGVPKRSKNDHFITSISMDDFGENGNLTNLFSVKDKNDHFLMVFT